MSIRLCIVALCLSSLLLSCLSAKIVSEDAESVPNEKDITVTVINESDSVNVTLKYPHDEEPKPEDDSSSEETDKDKEKKKEEKNLKSDSGESSESSSSEEKKNKRKLDFNESNEDSSSEEKTVKRSIRRRSLDSKQDSVNTIGGNVNQTATKESSNSDKDESQTSETSTHSDNKELSVSTTLIDVPETQPASTSDIDAATTENSPTESTTLESDSPASDTVAETVSEATTESESVTGSSEIETTPEAGAALETASESQPETEKISEPITTSTTTTETSADTSSSSEDKVEETSSVIPSSTPSIGLDSPKPEKAEQSFFEVAMDRVNKLSDQIRLVLIQYRKDKVVVLPGQKFFPDPMQMQDFRQSFSVGTMDFKNMRVLGLSNFTVEHINTDVDKMQVYILLHMKRLVILGNYTLRTFFSRAAGPFNVTLLEVDSEGVAEIETASEGHLEATDSVMDMFTQDMRVDFKNLGFMGSMFQGVVSTVGDALFNSIKPQILERVNLVIRTDVNKKLKEFSVKFINKVSPVELAFSEGRKYARTHGYDPYNIRDHTFILGGLVYINITEFWVEGLSKFYRVGNLSLSMDSGVIQIGVHVMTQKLTGHCAWSGQTFGIVKSGKTNFTVDHLQVRALVNQSLDIRKKPQLEDLDLELGWVKVTMDSPMTLNLMIEGIINAFPRLIRHIIVDTLEVPLKEKIQEILDKINVEAIVDDNLPRLDKFGL